MPFKHKEDEKAYKKRYYKENKEKIQIKNEENKEAISEKHKQYYQKNKEHINEKYKEWSKTPSGIKSMNIRNWKRKGIKSDNYDILYDNYLKAKNCEECGIPFGKYGDGSGTFKCCDHSHLTGLFRNFLCHSCNIKRGE